MLSGAAHLAAINHMGEGALTKGWQENGIRYANAVEPQGVAPRIASRSTVVVQYAIHMTCRAGFHQSGDALGH